VYGIEILDLKALLPYQDSRSGGKSNKQCQ
jgi:hypothetical protein